MRRLSLLLVACSAACAAAGATSPPLAPPPHQPRRALLTEPYTSLMPENVTPPPVAAAAPEAPPPPPPALPAPSAAGAAAGPAPDCADPAALKAAGGELFPASEAEIIVTGTVVTAGAGAARCAANGTAVADYGPSGVADGGGRLLALVSVTCVNKGAVVCRGGAGGGAGAAFGECLLLVEAAPSDAACAVAAGARYTLLLSGPPADLRPEITAAGEDGGNRTSGGAADELDESRSSCADGRYATAAPLLPLFHSIRPTLGTGGCAPYPSFPAASPDAPRNGTLARALLSAGGAARCAGDPCAAEGVGCAAGSGVACVTKAAEGRVAVHNLVLPGGACTPAYIDLVTGLPAAFGCDTRIQAAARRGRRAAAIAESGAAGNPSASAALGSGGARPRLDDAGRILGSELERGAADALQAVARGLGAGRSAAGGGAAGAVRAAGRLG
ncbi:MAG: hypothetical protein J3K34DRAFT_456307 [Monoraphidium minutum]|nr:MAG: hypothetical protein J3K34DRAFT_456307 [Monoraphidium minutum]